MFTFTLWALRIAHLTLPLRLLWLVLWPFALVRAIHQLGRDWPSRMELIDSPVGRHLVGSWSIRTMNLLMGRVRIKLTDLGFLWADRLGSGHYEKSEADRSPGWDHLKNHATRPVILLTLHFGPSYMLLNWLRSMSVPAAMVTSRGIFEKMDYRRPYRELRDRAAGLTDIPNYIEIGGNTGEMLRHLELGRVLIIDVESGFSRHMVEPHVDGLGLRMSTGPMTLGYLSGALLIPCTISAEPYFGFSVHFGEPVNAPDRADKSELNACADHVLREFLPTIRQGPAEISYVLLRNLTEAVM